MRLLVLAALALGFAIPPGDAADEPPLLLPSELCLANDTTPSSRNLVRRRRSLTFPKGSAFVLTATLLKPIQVKFPTNWNLDLEFDMIWPIPKGINVRKRPRRPSPPPMRRLPLPMRRPPIWPHRRHRRDLYANLELALDSQGFPGSQCILRTICEAKFILNPPGVSLIEDVLRVVFSYPMMNSPLVYDAYDKAHATPDDCDTTYPCPFSILDVLLNYPTHV